MLIRYMHVITIAITIKYQRWVSFEAYNMGSLLPIHGRPNGGTLAGYPDDVIVTLYRVGESTTVQPSPQTTHHRPQPSRFRHDLGCHTTFLLGMYKWVCQLQ